jgi:hypothetical protein
MAAYPLDVEHHTEDGELNLRYFLMHRPDPIDELRELCQQLEHLNRVQSPIINYARQMLAWQLREVAHLKSTTTLSGFVPPLWGWLAGLESEVSPTSWKRLQNQYSKSIAIAYNLRIDPLLQLHADWLCDIKKTEQELEAEISELLTDDCFKVYNSIFDAFGFGLRVREALTKR